VIIGIAIEIETRGELPDSDPDPDPDFDFDFDFDFDGLHRVALQRLDASAKISASQGSLVAAT